MKTSLPRQAIQCIAALSVCLAIQASADVQLLPAGEFAGRDGRPGPGKTWKLNDAQGQAIAAALNARHGEGRAKFVLDYDHQTLLAAKNGQPAPASGWSRQFAWRPGQGLFALNVSWTERAKALIDAEEYMYISPVIGFDEATGEVQDVMLAALTNYPCLMEMGAVTQAVAQLNATGSSFSLPNQPSESSMTLLAALMAALVLPAETTEAQAIEAVKTLKTKADTPPKALVPAALSAALGIKPEADEATALSAVATLKGTGAAANGFDTTSVKLVQEMQAQVAALTAQIHGDRVTQMVTEALSAGKLVPAQKDWAIKLGQTSVEQLSAFIAAAPVIAGALGTPQSGGKEGGTGSGTGVAALSSDELRIATAMGIKPEDFKAAAAAT